MPRCPKRIDNLGCGDGSAINLINSTASSFRLELDNSSSPDPITGGLLVNVGDYGPNNQFNLPWSTTVNVGLCKSYVDNQIIPSTGLPDYDMTNVSTGIIHFNNAGKFHITFNTYILGTSDPPNSTIFQILLNGQLIFSNPTPLAFGNQFGSDISSYLGPVFTKIWSYNGSANVDITAGSDLVLQCILGNTVDPVVLPLCNNISCFRINASYYGLQGPPGPIGTNDNIYNIDGTLTGNRNVNLNGNSLTFNNPGNNSLVMTNDITLTTLPGNDIILQSSEDIILEPINNLRFVSLDNVIPAGNNVIYFDPLTSNVTYGAPPSGSNIYNSNGALTANRIVNTGTFSLTFNATTGFMSWNSPRYTFNNSADFRLNSLNVFNRNTSVLTYGALGRVSQTSILTGTIWTKQICSLSVPNITIPTVTTQTLNNLTVPATYGYQQNAGLISVNLVNGTFTSGSDNTGFYYYSFQCSLSITAIDAGIVDIFLNSSIDGVVYTIRENFTAGQNIMINFYKDIFIATNNNIFTFQVNNQTTNDINIISPYSSICVNRI